MREFVKLLILFSVLFITTGEPAAQEKSLVNMSQSPHALMWGIDMGDASWTHGFWAERFGICRDSMVPSMWQIMNSPDISHSFRNFEIAAGTHNGCHVGPPFHDGDFFKWFESLAAVYMQTGDPELDSLMGEIIPYIARSQREDGYIHTPVIIEQANDPEKKLEFRERLDFETYNMGHLMTAACVHYRATGKRTLLDVAEKAGDFLIDFYQRDPEELAQNAICPSHYMGVAELYRCTGKERYLELAVNLIEIRNLVKEGTDHNQDRIPFREQRTAIGHAVRANYLYAGVADLVAETGDSSLMVALEAIWRDLVDHKLYITGGCGALYDGVSPDGTSYSPPYIQQVHQAYGRPYQLPNSTAHNESCANIGNVLWAWRMLMMTGDAEYSDVLERTLYNAVLPSVSLDGKRYFYTNPLRVDQDLPYTLRWSKEREEYISLCNCCPPNIVRTLAETGNYLYSMSERGIWFNIYGANVLETTLPDGSELALEQAGDYPWDGRIGIKLKKIPLKEMSFFLRIPGWADKAELTVNGEAVKEKPEPGSYFELRRKWKKGDVIVLDIPMRSRLIRSHHLVEETANQVAVQRGPVVYCMESPDVPDSLRVFDVAIPAGIRFSESEEHIDKARMLALHGEALLIGRSKEDDGLYRELDTAGAVRVPVRLIPYYAWGNRGKGDMTVWMAVDY
jgi:DUF1680 family protein